MKKGNLLCRWDNTPHFSNLRNAPHHIHLSEDEVVPGNPTDIFRILEAI